MKVDNESIKNVLSGMLGNIEQDKIDLYHKIISENEKIKIDDYDTFYYSLIYPYKQFLEGLISVELSNKREVKFILLHSQYIERHFNKIIVDKEGSACSSDKSRTIVRRLMNWFEKGERIEFDYEGEYTYHLPKTVFKTHEEIVAFYEALENLYYGNAQKYLNEMLTLIKK